MLSRSRVKLALFLLFSLTLVWACQVSRKKEMYRSKIKFEPPRSTRSSKVALPGRYFGYMRLLDRKVKIPLVVDLVALKTRKKMTSFKSVVKFNMGAFDSSEYHAEFFDDVVFDSENSKFIFPVEKSKHRIVNVTLAAKNVVSGKIDSPDGKPLGEFLLVYGGKRRRLNVVKHVSGIYPKHTSIGQLKGLYKGQCEQREVSLELQSSRWRSDKNKTNVFLNEYRFTGRWGYVDKVLCGVSDQPCTRSNFLSGDYDLRSGVLELAGRPRSNSCRMEAGFVECGKCRLDRVVQQEPDKAGLLRLLARSERQDDFKIDRSKLLPRRPDFVGALEGEYFGHIYNEHTLQYQFMRLKVSVKGERVGKSAWKKMNVSGIATLFFGGTNSKEFLVYKFRPESYVSTSPHFVFDGSGESFMQVSSWAEGQISGIWYSKTVGRVGVVKMSRGTVPALAENGVEVKTISGSYVAPSMQINLLAQSDISLSEREFFPLIAKGLALRKGSQEKRTFIKDVSFDFMTGHIAFMLDKESIASGKLTDSGFEISWPIAHKFGSVMGVQAPEQYIYNEDPFSGTTAKQMFELLKPSNRRIKGIF